MALSLYDVTVANFLQTAGAIAGVLDKARAHFEASGKNPDEIVGARLAPDMFPFSFQVLCVAHHSVGAIAGVRGGEFLPPSSMGASDYAGMQAQIAEAIAALKALDRAEVDALQGKDVIFSLGPNKLPFVAEGFLLSFSLPNFYFHATTAYDVLRANGVPLGKRDFMGAMRMKR